MSLSTKPGGSFFRGDVLNRYPRRDDLFTGNAIQDHILAGWMPKEPFIKPTTNIVAFGSCFAANIGRYLHQAGFDIATAKEGSAHVQKISDGLVNVYSIASQFKWAWENRVPSVALWHGWNAEEFGYDEEQRLATKALFDKADVFILTFGLSEIWYDEPTGEVFWRAVPAEKFDAKRHKFRAATHAETLAELRSIYDLIRKYRPEATIIFTLSPVGLAATFRPVSCIAANAVSKATLRAAIDELHRTTDDANFYYFPAYEVVTQGFRVPFNQDLRHPQIHVITANMKAFERYFCETGLTDADLKTALKDALDLDEASSVDPNGARDIVRELRERFTIGSTAALRERRLAHKKRPEARSKDKATRIEERKLLSAKKLEAKKLKAKKLKAKRLAVRAERMERRSSR